MVVPYSLETDYGITIITYHVCLCMSMISTVKNTLYLHSKIHKYYANNIY